MTKYLWLITQDVFTAWSTYHSAVVIAATEHEAKRVLPTSKSLSSPITWCAHDFVSAKCLGVAEPGLEGDLLGENTNVICVSRTAKGG